MEKNRFDYIRHIKASPITFKLETHKKDTLNFSFGNVFFSLCASPLYHKLNKKSVRFAQLKFIG